MPWVTRVFLWCGSGGALGDHLAPLGNTNGLLVGHWVTTGALRGAVGDRWDTLGGGFGGPLGDVWGVALVIPIVNIGKAMAGILGGSWDPMRGPWWAIGDAWPREPLGDN